MLIAITHKQKMKGSIEQLLDEALTDIGDGDDVTAVATSETTTDVAAGNMDGLSASTGDAEPGAAPSAPAAEAPAPAE